VHELLKPAVLSATGIRQRSWAPHDSYRLNLLCTQHFFASIACCHCYFDAFSVTHAHCGAGQVGQAEDSAVLVLAGYLQRQCVRTADSRNADV
jgi:hypothetical protein